MFDWLPSWAIMTLGIIGFCGFVLIVALAYAAAYRDEEEDYRNNPDNPR